MAIGVSGCALGAWTITQATEIGVPLLNSGFSASRHALVNTHALSTVELLISPTRQRHPCDGSIVELLGNPGLIDKRLCVGIVGANVVSDWVSRDS